MSTPVIILTLIHAISIIAYFLIRRAIHHFAKSQLLTIGTEQEKVIMNRTFHILFAAYITLITIITVGSYILLLPA